MNRSKPDLKSTIDELEYYFKSISDHPTSDKNIIKRTRNVVLDFHNIYDLCIKIKELEKKKWEKADKYKQLIVLKGNKEFVNIATNYNTALDKLEDDGGYSLVLKDIEQQFTNYKKKLIAITLNGLFIKSYNRYKKYYANKHNQDLNKENGSYYPKSAEYARLSIQFPMIYNGCKDVIKLLIFCWTANTAEPITESRQKVLMDRDTNRSHTGRKKMEMEQIDTEIMKKEYVELVLKWVKQ